MGPATPTHVDENKDRQQKSQLRRMKRCQLIFNTLFTQRTVRFTEQRKWKWLESFLLVSFYTFNYGCYLHITLNQRHNWLAGGGISPFAVLQHKWIVICQGDQLTTVIYPWAKGLGCRLTTRRWQKLVCCHPSSLILYFNFILQR